MPREGASSLEGQRLKPEEEDECVAPVGRSLQPSQGEGSSAVPWVWRSVFAENTWATRLTRKKVEASKWRQWVHQMGVCRK